MKNRKIHNKAAIHGVSQEVYAFARVLETALLDSTDAEHDRAIVTFHGLWSRGDMDIRRCGDQIMFDTIPRNRISTMLFQQPRTVLVVRSFSKQRKETATNFPIKRIVSFVGCRGEPFQRLGPETNRGMHCLDSDTGAAIEPERGVEYV